MTGVAAMPTLPRRWRVTIDQRAGSGESQRFTHESTAPTLGFATTEAIEAARLVEAEVGDYQITATRILR